MRDGEKTIVSGVEVALDSLSRDAFGGWAAVLNMGKIQHDEANLPSNKVWSELDGLAYFSRQFKKACAGYESTYPWVVQDGNVIVDQSFIKIGNLWIKGRQTTEDIRYALLALIGFADERLLEFLRRIKTKSARLRHEPRREFEKHKLVELPLKKDKWWDFIYRSNNVKRERTSKNFGFSDGLNAVVPVPAYVKVFSSREVGLGSNEYNQNLNIALIAPAIQYGVHFEAELRRDKIGNDPAFRILNLRPGWVQQTLKSLSDANCTMKDADIVVLPEFTVSEEERKLLQTSWQYKSILIAGSGHIELENNKIANRSSIIFQTAHPLKHSTPPKIAHLKKYPFRVKAGNELFNTILQLCGEDLLTHNLIINNGLISECLEEFGGNNDHPIIVVESPWGRFSVLICRDFIEDWADAKILPSLISAKVDHIFIPSYNPGPSDNFIETAEKLSKIHGIATYIVDSFCDTKDKCSKWIVRVPIDKKNQPWFDFPQEKEDPNNLDILRIIHMKEKIDEWHEYKKGIK